MRIKWQRDWGPLAQLQDSVKPKGNYTPKLLAPSTWHTHNDNYLAAASTITSAISSGNPIWLSW
jgi:hypothetical protein